MNFVEATPKGSIADLIAVLERLTEKEKIKQKHIAALTPYRDRSNLDWGAITKRFPAIDLDTISRYKGMDKPVVVVTEIDGIVLDSKNVVLDSKKTQPQKSGVLDESQLYVAFSRAKSYLIVLAGGGAIKALNDKPAYRLPEHRPNRES